MGSFSQLYLVMYYSRTLVAQTLSAHLPWLFRTFLESLGKNPIAADLGFLFEPGVCLSSVCQYVHMYISP